MKHRGLKLSTLLVSAAIMFTGCGSKEKEVLSYLNEKYQEEFVIDHLTNGSILNATNPYGIAHLKNNENIYFETGIVDINRDNPKYWDSYLMTLWANELDDDFRGMIDNRIQVKYKSKVHLYTSSDVEEYDLKDLSAKEFLQHEKENGHISLYIAIEVQDDSEVKDYFSTIYNLYQDIKDTSDNRCSLIVGFVKDLEDESIDDIMYKGKAYQINWKNLDSDKLYGQLIYTYVDKVNSPEELEELYNKDNNR